jgi:two-component system, chemotaxis family, CheB/CheR fusion protein
MVLKKQPSDRKPEAGSVIKEEDTAPPFLTVAIGASAGGHAPLEQIFTLLPADCRLCFVVIMHLPAEGPSLLADILSSHTSLQVVTVEDGMMLQSNTVHVVPPGKDLTMDGGRLRLVTREAGRIPHPIDRFFSSLAADLGRSAIAVILSGFGSDGAEGVKRIKEEGGRVLIQDPETAINPFHAAKRHRHRYGGFHPCRSRNCRQACPDCPGRKQFSHGNLPDPPEMRSSAPCLRS